MFRPLAGVRRLSATQPGRGALRRRGEHRFARLARHLDCRGAIGLAEALGVGQRQAGALAGAQDYQRAMTAGAAHPLIFAAIDRVHRSLGDGDLGIAADQPKPPGDARRIGRRRVEHRCRLDPLAADFEKRRHRIEPVEREFLDCHLSAERRRFRSQPLGAGIVARSRGAVGALRIPRDKPALGAPSCLIED